MTCALGRVRNSVGRDLGLPAVRHSLGVRLLHEPEVLSLSLPQLSEPAGQKDFRGGLVTNYSLKFGRLTDGFLNEY